MGKSEELRAKLVEGEITAPSNIEQDVVFAGAVQSLPVTVKAKETTSDDTLVGDPVANGATVTVTANGGTPSVATSRSRRA